MPFLGFTIENTRNPKGPKGLGPLQTNQIYSSRSTDIQAAHEFSSERISPRSKPLYLVNCAPRSALQHWGLFLPSDDNPHVGNFWDLVVDNNESQALSCCLARGLASIIPSIRGRAKCQKMPQFDMKRALRSGKECLEIGEPVSTDDRVDRACKIVFRDFKYKLATSNCQSFVIEVIKLLHAWNPKMVDKTAVVLAQSNAVFTVRRGRLANRPHNYTGARLIFNSEADERWVADAGWRFPGRVVLPAEPARFVDPADRLGPLPENLKKLSGREVRKSEPDQKREKERAQRRKVYSEVYSDLQPATKLPRREGARSDPVTGDRPTMKPRVVVAEKLWHHVTLSEENGRDGIVVPGAWDPDWE